MKSFMRNRLRLTASLLVLGLCLTFVPFASAGTDDPDLTVVTEIRQEGFRHSQVMEILSDLTDMIGPRLTGSPSMKHANDWTRDKLTSFGLTNAHLESWGTFGRGWENEFTSVRMVAPDVSMLYAIPKAWSPGTERRREGRRDPAEGQQARGPGTVSWEGSRQDRDGRRPQGSENP